MSAQAAIYETITAMKKAMARRDDASDSDSSIAQPTNRGNKLKRKARFVREGRLDQAAGPRVYKRRLLYNGYVRNVISRNPARVDPDGDVVDEDHDDSDPDVTSADEDPYTDVKLENLLMPLTAAADLDKHPSLSLPYTSKALDEMIRNVQDLVHREQAALWRMKRLTVQFRGDDMWAPCGAFEGDDDYKTLEDLEPVVPASATASVQMEIDRAPDVTWEDASNPRLAPDAEEAAFPGQMQAAAENENHTSSVVPIQPSLDANSGEEGQAGTSDVAMQDSTHTATSGDGAATPEQVNGRITDENRSDKQGDLDDMVEGGENTLASNIKSEGADSRDAAVDSSTDPASQDKKEPGPDTISNNASGAQANGIEGVASDGQQAHLDNGGAEQTEDGDINGPATADDEPQPHRMTTRARAQATNPSPPLTTSGSPNLSTITALPMVHPFFLAPDLSNPCPNAGLSSPVVDEARRLFSNYTQKQEEVVRQAQLLLSGLQKASRLRHTVWCWCRNEGHVGEMSDGEDWIDMEEWNLDEPLRKGEEVEDDDVGLVQGKKTRNRRAAA